MYGSSYRQFHLALLTLLYLLASGPSGAAQMQVKAHQSGSLLEVEGWLAVAVDRATAWEVLTDYEHFPEFVPGIRMNRILDVQGDRKWLEQQGEVRAGSLNMPYGGQILVDESPGKGMHIRFLNGLLKDIEGDWHVESGRPLKLSYRILIDLTKSPFPAPLAPQFAEQQVRDWVNVFAREMERRHKEKGESR